MPTLLAFLFGVITFKRHIYGVYCAVITLAESLILQDFIIEYQAYTGGFNGITDYGNYAANIYFLWFMLAVTVLFFVAGRVLTHSRVGTVLKSIRDNDVRAEFMGYNVANYRIFVFCVSAFMAAAAGAMYAAWVGMVSFLDTGPVFSVEAVIWTAVGGRATLIGPFVGAFLVKGPEFLLSGAGSPITGSWSWAACSSSSCCGCPTASSDRSAIGCASAARGRSSRSCRTPTRSRPTGSATGSRRRGASAEILRAGGGCPWPAPRNHAA